MGIDQAIRSTGLTLMDVQGNVIAQRVVHIPAKFKIQDDIDIIFDVTNKVVEFIQDRNVLAVCIETPAMSAMSMRSKQLNMLFGSIVKALELPYFIGNPTAIKKFATGKGSHNKSEKKEVMIDAWIDADSVSHSKAHKFLTKTYTKSVVTRAIGDLADSFWLANYGLHQLRVHIPDIGDILRTKDDVASAIANLNPSVLVADIDMEKLDDT